MSQHIFIGQPNKRKFVFGWDQPLQSFFLQVHEATKYASGHFEYLEEGNPVVWLGTAGSQMYEVEDLVREAKKYGLDIPQATQTALYGEKDDGR